MREKKTKNYDKLIAYLTFCVSFVSNNENDLVLITDRDTQFLRLIIDLFRFLYSNQQHCNCFLHENFRFENIIYY
jgi:hypothetical protein